MNGNVQSSKKLIWKEINKCVNGFNTVKDRNWKIVTSYEDIRVERKEYLESV